MPKVKEKMLETEPKTLHEVNPRTAFIEKYRAAGYNASDTDGILMFTGDYQIKAISKMLDADGYRGSYGVKRIIG